MGESDHSPDWASLSLDELLNLRVNQLGVQVEGTWLEDCVQRLHGELAAKGLVYKPRVWLSSEWFSADGVPGVAAPFYLAHPKLMRLEKKMMLQVEGGTREACMKILRHETGHAIDTAYRLHRRKRWRETFGSFAAPYPDYYRPRPNSQEYVLHLGLWYAQAHPAEDFAETFAVWLNPRSRWRKRYQGWKALRKLEYVDEVMGEIAGVSPPVKSRRKVEPLSGIRKTLREHYREKRMRYLNEWPEVYDADLRKLFSDDPRYRRRPSAAQFLRRIQPEIRQTTAQWTGVHQYTIDQVLQDMIDRCKELGMRLTRSRTATARDATIMITVQTMNFLHRGQLWIPL